MHNYTFVFKNNQILIQKCQKFLENNVTRISL